MTTAGVGPCTGLVESQVYLGQDVTVEAASIKSVISSHTLAYLTLRANTPEFRGHTDELQHDYHLCVAMLGNNYGRIRFLQLRHFHLSAHHRDHDDC